MSLPRRLLAFTVLGTVTLVMPQLAFRSDGGSVSTTAFIDWMHPSEAGNELIARGILPVVEQRLRATAR